MKKLLRLDGNASAAIFPTHCLAGRFGLGDKIRLIPGHCNPIVNFYDWYACIRGSRVEQVWPITARGAGY